MGKLYHGSSESGLTTLKPSQSTHGKYVYATEYKELTIIFCKRCGDDLTYSLYRNEKTDPWILVERIPNGLNTMFSNSASIYTLDDKTFKDIHTGFCEVVSDVEVPIEKEEKIENVKEAVEKLAKEGKVIIYRYPNKPKEIPTDDSDLLRKEIEAYERCNQEITENSFRRLLFLHPNLLDKVNKYLEEHNLQSYSKEDLIKNFELFVMFQDLYPDKEHFIESGAIAISKLYPELADRFKEILSFPNKPNKEKIKKYLELLPIISRSMLKEELDNIKEEYYETDKTFKEVATEIRDRIIGR